MVIKVLLYYFFLRDQFKNSLKTDLMQSVKTDVERVWQKSGIKTMARQNMLKKLLKLVEKYQVLKKDSLKTRKTEPFQKKRQEWRDALDTTFDCAAPDAEEVLRNSRLLGEGDKQEDIDFLIDQRTARQQFMGQRDKNFDLKQAEKESREKRQEKMSSSEKERVRVVKQE